MMRARSDEKSLAAGDLERAAEALEAQAADLRRRAEETHRDAWRSAERERWQDAQREAAAILREHGDGDIGRAMALRALMAGAREDFDPDYRRKACEMMLAEALRQNTRLSRGLRDREVMRLYRRKSSQVAEDPNELILLALGLGFNFDDAAALGVAIAFFEAARLEAAFEGAFRLFTLAHRRFPSLV